MADFVVDATNAILGRLATTCAKRALLGDKVIVLNAEKAVISGRPSTIIEDHLVFRTEVGQIRQGPFYFTQPDRFVRRTIRGMLPHQQPRGREAYARIRCYRGVPEAYANTKAISLENADMKKLPTLRRITVAQLLRQVGGTQ